MEYIIKNNLPAQEGISQVRVWNREEAAQEDFNDILIALSRRHFVKTFFRNKPLRGQIQVEIDGFYYYVELFIKIK